MTIHRFLSKHGWPERKLAALVGVSQPTINKIMRGERNASLRLALHIERVTDGEIRARDLNVSSQTKRDLKALRG